MFKNIPVGNIASTFVVNRGFVAAISTIPHFCEIKFVIRLPFGSARIHCAYYRYLRKHRQKSTFPKLSSSSSIFLTALCSTAYQIDFPCCLQLETELYFLLLSFILFMFKLHLYVFKTSNLLTVISPVYQSSFH